MTAHKVVASDEVDGIALSCVHPTCDFAERGYGHTETAGPVARLHEAEARIDTFDETVRCHAEQAATVARQFPPSGYSAGYAAAMRDVLPAWAGDEKERRAA